MLISLLDLRGPEERIKSSIPDQKTIIILDSSASMLAEDIRPSRFSKAIQMARHFVKNAAGHQISIVLFSDIQKRLIPFTDDIDLLDSRLAALEKTNSVSGGSNISQAIAEAAGYLDDDKNSATGNILVFTDAEESEEGMDVELGNNINLAVVGIGTAKGGNIPLRWDDGSFRGYKTSKGEPVITRLDEAYIKKIGKNVKNYKYWIANSYSLPTDDILNFFRGSFNKATGKGDVRIRPVFSHLILIPAIVIYCLSVVLGRFGSFKKVLSLAIIFFSLTGGEASFADENEKNVKPLPASLVQKLNKMKSGKADRKEVLKIAEELMKNNQDERARELYNEYAKDGDEDAVKFNRATALLKTNRFDEAMPLIQSVMQNSKSEKMKDQMRKNILLAMNQGSGDKNKDNKKDKDEQKEDDQKKDSKDGKEGQDKKDQKGDQNKEGQGSKDKNDKNGQGKENQKDQKNGKDGQNNEDKKDDKAKENQKDPKDLEKPERGDAKPQTLEEKEKMIEQKRKMVKTPAMVKQILSDDRELQKKMMDTSTNERGSQKPKRDW